jgi:manganese-dependent ADP-ribose/CDP-alcohol diphosphatase
MANLVIIEDEPSTSPPTSSMFEAPDPNINQSTYNENETIKPIISFGLITDIQYADNDDQWNYTKTHLRRYRNALKLVDEACHYWLNGKYSISFILQLGDIIDGISFKNKTSIEDLNAVLEQFKRNFKSFPIYHIWGNHELYNFTRLELLNGPLCSFDTKKSSPGHYGTFEVCPNLRIIALDTYEFSALGVEKDSEVYIQAMELLEKHNQNKSPNDPTGLRGHQRRFVQFNGGITLKQLNWLKEQLTEAKNRNEKVILIGNFILISMKFFYFLFFLLRSYSNSSECM